MRIIEVRDNYSELGILSRPITKGQEFDMVLEFIDFKKETFKTTDHKQLAVFVEIKINDAYPDVIFVEYDPSMYEKWNINRNKLTMSDLKLLYYIYSKRKVVTTRAIKELSIQYKPLLGSLEALIDAELVDRIDGYWVVPNRKDVFGVKRIEAVEAKISKWDKAIQQAIVNKSFASESFVLSKRKRIPDATVVERMNSFGIGIYLYDSNQFSCYSPACHNKFPANYNSLYLNECIGRVINSQ